MSAAANAAKRFPEAAGDKAAVATPLRVLLVDDSPTVRAVLRRILRTADDIEVVGEAEDGERGVELAAALRPDVILMDLTMPRVDGFEATQRIMAANPTAILVLSTEVRDADGRTVFESVEAGARSVLAKPGSPDAWTDLATELPELVRGVARDFGVAQDPQPIAAVPPPAPCPDLPMRWVVVGASTGGPEALRDFLAGLAPSPPFSILVVQHIAPEFEAGLVDWLRRDVRLDVRLGRDGELVPPGAVRLGPQGSHLTLETSGRLRLDHETPPRRGHRPAVDELFLSCAASTGRGECAGVLLSGMGRDGVEGLQALRDAGGLTLAQDHDSSVIFGMPAAALEHGAARLALPPAELATYLLEACGATS